MDYKELTQLSKEELEKMLAERQEGLRALRFKVANRQLKNVRQARQTRKDIARILTAISNVSKHS